jgi:hypothetical protein
LVLVHGTVRQASTASLTFTNSATGHDWMLDGPFGALVTRNHHGGLGVTALRSGDGLTVVLDARGRVRAIDAQGASAPLPAATPIAAPPAAPPAALASAGAWLSSHHWSGLLSPSLGVGVLLAVLLVGFALLARLRSDERRLPFALVERRPDIRDGAPPPASYELTRESPVSCADGPIGHLVHVVLVPQTGALRRLIVRDRDNLLSEIPAALMTSAGPSGVSLAPTWTELLALLQGVALFSARRYQALAVGSAPARAPGLLIEETPDALHIAVMTGAETPEGAPQEMAQSSPP